MHTLINPHERPPCTNIIVRIIFYRGPNEVTQVLTNNFSHEAGRSCTCVQKYTWCNGICVRISPTLTTPSSNMWNLLQYVFHHAWARGWLCYQHADQHRTPIHPPLPLLTTALENVPQSPKLTNHIKKKKTRLSQGEKTNLLHKERKPTLYELLKFILIWIFYIYWVFYFQYLLDISVDVILLPLLVVIFYHFIVLYLI